jgi:hypothetical protein
MKRTVVVLASAGVLVLSAVASPAMFGGLAIMTVIRRRTVATRILGPPTTILVQPTAYTLAGRTRWIRLPLSAGGQLRLCLLWRPPIAAS